MANNSKKHINKKYKEDILFFRMSMLFILTCVAVVGIFRLSGGRVAFEFYKLAHNPVYMIIIGLLFAASAAYMFICKKNKCDESAKSFSSSNYFSIMAYVLGISLYWGYTNAPSIRFVLAATICLPLLYFINNIYKKDFLMFSVSNFIFLCALWCFSIKGLGSAIVSAVLVAASAAICVINYKLSRKAKDTERFELVPVSFIIAIALIVCENLIAIPFVTTSVASAVMLFQYLAGAIYYTVKLIREA